MKKHQIGLILVATCLTLNLVSCATMQKQDEAQMERDQAKTGERKERVKPPQHVQEGRLAMDKTALNGQSPVTSDREILQPPFNTEEYARIYENPFLETIKNPLSTFSIDVDTASYSNIRRFISQNQMPPKDAVRVEEMLNYFNYDYPEPKGEHPFSLTTEISECPWNTQHKLLHIGLQGKKMNLADAPPSNLVFLLDVSGSMNDPNKLPLVKSSLKLMVNQINSKDKIAIVVYAGAAGLVLPPTSGEKKSEILAALGRLEAGGSTAGGAGIKLAYEMAKQYRIRDGNNRVILATDGDFNVGPSSDGELIRLIEEKRKDGIFLTVLGFGMGNYKDSKMENLADKGNGNYAYIDSILEAKKVLISEMGSTLHTIAKDVKLQVEFNPAQVSQYRLIGYENRIMRAEDFEDDQKDAGELGAGHTVTALYEVVEANEKSQSKGNDLKYQEMVIKSGSHLTDELLTLKLRYKKPDQDVSQLITVPVKNQPIQLARTSDNFRFSASVAGFGLMLRESQYTGDLTYEEVLTMAKHAVGSDQGGYRYEFVQLVEKAKLLKLNN